MRSESTLRSKSEVRHFFIELRSFATGSVNRVTQKKIVECYTSERMIELDWNKRFLLSHAVGACRKIKCICALAAIYKKFSAARKACGCLIFSIERRRRVKVHNSSQSMDL